MKKFLVLSSILFLSLLVFLPQAQAVGLDSFEVGEKDIFIPQGTVIEKVLFSAGENVNIDIDAKDDIYVAGGNVFISGNIDGDVFAAGGIVVINANVKGNVRVAGGNVKINGNVEKNITSFAGDLQIADDAVVGGNVIFGAGTVGLYGKINKDVYGGGGSIILGNEILGDVFIETGHDGNILLSSDATIYGDFEYSAGEKASLQPGAKILGQDKFTLVKKSQKINFPTKQLFKGLYIGFYIISFFSALLIGLIILTLFKKFSEKVNKQIEKDILILILKGLVLVIITPIILLILAITIVGLPLVFILGSLFGIALYVSKIFVAVYLGNLFLKVFKGDDKNSQLLALFVGLLIIYIVFAIPVIGWLAKCVAVLWGMGALYVIIKKQLNIAE